MERWWVLVAGAVVIALLAGVVVGKRSQGGQSHPTKEPWALRHALPILTLGAAGAATAFTLAYRSIEGADKDRVDVGIKAATATVALVAGVLTWGRLELSRREHRLATDKDLTERYGRAIDQLGHTDPMIRAGGAYALERFALDSYEVSGLDTTDWRMALDMLATFVRSGLEKRKPSENLPADVQAALVAVGRFYTRVGLYPRFNIPQELFGVRGDWQRGDRPPVRYDLRGVNLAGVDLFDVELVGANLTGAALTSTSLAGADLADADLTGADLTDANLTDATGADLAYVSFLPTGEHKS